MRELYLLSKDVSLVKYFVDYSLTDRLYVLKGVCTISSFHEEWIPDDKKSVLVIDEKWAREANINVLELCRKHSLWNVFYLSNDMRHDRIEMKMLSNCHLMRSDTNFFELMRTLHRLEQHDIKLQHHKFDKYVNEYLIDCGIGPSLLGFNYLKDAITLKCKHPRIRMNEICDRVARKYNTTSSRTERCMRTALHHGHGRCMNHPDLHFLKKPSCMNFISTVASQLSSEE